MRDSKELGDSLPSITEVRHFDNILRQFRYVLVLRQEIQCFELSWMQNVTSAVEYRIRARVCSGYLPNTGVRDVADVTRRLVYLYLPNIDSQQPSFRGVRSSS
jgi:hypothetical protein